ncbi:uncharacterized protein LOC124798090 [Schistocerca piceifrons]|uniref:uncharacterized protein LOC124798090 n=1 Tax=Schistocerca piceifrons TaxID=274613 RepID=UPI001F5F4B2B|nr:uncharacterized protein LOC124798090 [Schistocerca piceifrons]
MAVSCARAVRSSDDHTRLFELSQEDAGVRGCARVVGAGAVRGAAADAEPVRAARAGVPAPPAAAAAAARPLHPHGGRLRWRQPSDQPASQSTPTCCCCHANVCCWWLCTAEEHPLHHCGGCLE